MSTMAPCCQPDSNVTLSVTERALQVSPAYHPDDILRDDLPITRRSLLLAAAAGSLAGALWAMVAR